MISENHLDVPMAGLTTMRVGGPARDLVEAHTADEIIDAVVSADADGVPVLLLGGGSNLVVADAGFEGRVVHVRTHGVDVDVTDCYGAWVTVAAGEKWTGLVDRAVSEGWVGIEALAGIPGSVGATPVQNVGAYGQDVSQTVARVELYDRETRRREVVPVDDCRFGYRTSRFKGSDRYVILSVAFQFRLGELSAPITYPELARALGVEVGARAPLVDVRTAVLSLRSAKGMLLDEADHDAWSVGSFFVNPIVPADSAMPSGVPTWSAGADVKVSAAWLIEHAGFGRGFSLPGSRAAISTKHTLALTNRGGATAEEILDLARAIRARVHGEFGIVLNVEPTLIGCSL